MYVVTFAGRVLCNEGLSAYNRQVHKVLVILFLIIMTYRTLGTMSSLQIKVSRLNVIPPQLQQRYKLELQPCCVFNTYSLHKNKHALIGAIRKFHK
jgi:hypothetical protein